MLALVISAGYCIAHAAGDNAATKPSWPNNGIAQRMFPMGNLMFVENDHGKWRAWVLEAAPGDQVQAMDFFSGERIQVKVDVEDDGRQEPDFTDAGGVAHVPAEKRFAFSGASPPISLPGITFEGNNIQLNSTIRNCYVNITSALSAIGSGQAQNATGSWSKFPIYHTSAGNGSCPSGDLGSKVTSALDLGDGTLLAAEGCFVFRLRKSDLSPVGSAPALRVVDESRVQKAVDQAKGRNIQDAAGYLAKALNLPTSTSLSCNEN